MNQMAKSKQLKLSKHLGFGITFVLIFNCLFAITATQNASADCKPVKPRGQSVGTINYGNKKMPIIPFTYPAGGVMEPQKTTRAAAISLRHMPLESKLGTSVIAWHVNFNGCINELNSLLYKSVGYRFSITDNNGVTRKYEISQKFNVKKGNYRKSWFSLVGPRKLAMFTCSGPFVNGHFRDNEVLIAVPVTEA